MIDFLLKSTISLGIFLGFYYLVLEREKMHQFNRFYLLFSIIISFVIPFLNFEIIKIVTVVQNFEPLNSIVTSSEIPENEIQENSLPIKESINFTPYILWSLYGIISFLLLIRFGKNIWKLILKSKFNPSIKFKNANLILIEEKTLPHTFLNSIFINFEDYNNRNIEDELYTHELVHVTQKHTFDILFIEFLKVIFWFNPIFIFYKKAIQLNHEFLADEEIVKTYNNVPFYQNLLLQKGSGQKTIYLASNLNYLVTKKRLIMMTKRTSKKTAILKKVAILPIIAGLIYFFCIEVVAQKKFIYTNYVDKNSYLTNKNNVQNNDEDSVKIVNENSKNSDEINKLKNVIISINNDKIENNIIVLNDKKEKKVIVIDAGHGGHDFGATKDELNEKNLISEITKKIKKLYSDSDVTILFTRTEDEFMDLKSRTDYINSNKADLVISLHVNNNKNTEANGFEIFVYDESDFLDKSKIFAEQLSSKLSKTSLKNRGIKMGPFFILKNSACPAIVVELGFISNENDRNYIVSEKGQTEIAQHIVAFISEVK